MHFSSVDLSLKPVLAVLRLFESNALVAGPVCATYKPIGTPDRTRPMDQTCSIVSMITLESDGLHLR